MKILFCENQLHKQIKITYTKENALRSIKYILLLKGQIKEVANEINYETPFSIQHDYPAYHAYHGPFMEGDSYVRQAKTGSCRLRKHYLIHFKADKAAGAAVAANNAELFNEVKTHLQAALDNSEDLLSIVSQEITKEHLHNIQKTSKEYVPLIDNILHLFKQFYATDAAITKIGYKLQDDLANIAEKEQQNYELTGNAENLLSCKLIGESFTNIRLAVANFLISYSDENLAVVKQRVKEAQEKTAPLKEPALRSHYRQHGLLH